MSDMTTADLSSWVGRTAVDRDGDKIGKITDVYLDDDSGEPEWLAVSTGLFGTKVSFVPIGGASPSGDDIEVAYDKATVKDSPNTEADGALSPQEEEMLYRHYRQGTADVDTSRGPETDDAMTRSDEEVDVDTTTRQTGKARLRKMSGGDLTSEQHEVVLSEEVIESEGDDTPPSR